MRVNCRGYAGVYDTIKLQLTRRETRYLFKIFNSGLDTFAHSPVINAYCIDFFSRFPLLRLTRGWNYGSIVLAWEQKLFPFHELKPTRSKDMNKYMQDYKYTDRDRTQDLEFIVTRLNQTYGDLKYVQELICHAMIGHKSLTTCPILTEILEQMKKLRELIDKDSEQIKDAYDLDKEL